jgi:chemotaxis methyl-accepting protein methylase
MMAGDAPDDAAFRALLEQVARARGFACANYKDGCLKRRVAVRMRARGVSDYGAYAALLTREPAEYEPLMEALTINVTRLYRDAPVWDLVASTVLPSLWALRSTGSFTAWSAGCASGEELYTLAAILHQHATRSGTQRQLLRTSVIGTDIDEPSLRAVARGEYSAEACTELPVALRDRYFGATAPHRASAELRALVRVEKRDLLLDDAPAAALQLITCRNVLIYLDREGQERILRRFHAALAPGGVVVLGKVESLFGAARALFEVVDQRQRIFRRSADS